jgi:RNA polymerase sigma-70 factor, ECF subfamily
VREIERDSITSNSLLLRIRDPRDTQSWEAFQSVYRPMIYAYCTRRGLQEADSLDVVQEVLTSVCRAIQTFDYRPEKGRFRAWLGTITANKIKTFKSRQHRVQSRNVYQAQDQVADTPIADPDSDWVSIFSEHIFQTACDRVKSRVEPSTWICFQSTWVDHQPAVEVAENLKIPVHSVYVNKSRVLKLLEREVLILAEDCLFDGNQYQLI